MHLRVEATRPLLVLFSFIGELHKPQEKNSCWPIGLLNVTVNHNNSRDLSREILRIDLFLVQDVVQVTPPCPPSFTPHLRPHDGETTGIALCEYGERYTRAIRSKPGIEDLFRRLGFLKKGVAPPSSRFDVCFREAGVVLAFQPTNSWGDVSSKNGFGTKSPAACSENRPGQLLNLDYGLTPATARCLQVVMASCQASGFAAEVRSARGLEGTCNISTLHADLIFLPYQGRV